MTPDELIKSVSTATGITYEIVEFDFNTLLTHGRLILGNISIHIDENPDMETLAKALISAYTHTDIKTSKNKGVAIQIWD